MLQPPLSSWDKFKLMLWKNWNTLWNFRGQLTLAILSPLLFSLVLILARFMVGVYGVDVTKYSPINLQDAWRSLLDDLRNEVAHLSSPVGYSCFVPRLQLAYAPNESRVNREIMEGAARYLDGVGVVGFADERELREAMARENYLAGVRFIENTVLTRQPQPQSPPLEAEAEAEAMYAGTQRQFAFALVFPSVLRNYFDTFIGANWNTNNLFDVFAIQKHRFEDHNDGGFVGYIREGFVPIQHAVSMAFMQRLGGGGTNLSLPGVDMQRFPHYHQSCDHLLGSLQVSLSFILLLGFLYPCMHITMLIMRDKERRQKAIVETLGIDYSIQVYAWFLNSLFTLGIGLVLVLIVFKIHWNDGFGICSKSSWLALFVFMLAYLLASVGFCFMVSSFFSRVSSALISLPLLWFLSYFPFVLTANRIEHESSVAQMSQCVLSNCLLGMGVDAILKYEQFGDGFQLSSFFDRPTLDDHLTVGSMTVLLLTLAVAYTALGLLVDVLLARLHDYKTSVKFRWRRMIPSQFRTGRRTARSIPFQRMTKIYEIEPESKERTVDVEGLRKEFSGVCVVHDVTLSLFGGEITVLMGHNGSGKTTLLSLIVGLLRPKRGRVAIHGHDLQHDAENRARALLGVGLQDDGLYPDLSVYNQIYFYCRLKGMAEAEIPREVRKYMKAMDLLDVVNVVTRDLTSGVKRRLSVCCALCGNSPVVVLDDPSKGLDLVARRQLWELLILEKPKRTILLTSQSPDEADFLGDRIAMMSGGELKCFGSSFFLRHFYGSGYRLICAKEADCETSVVTEVIQQFIPEARPECDIGNELSYRMEEKHTELFARILDELEARLFELKIISCSISEPTIDDIFLDMGTQDPSESDTVRHSEILNGISAFVEEYDRLEFLKDHDRSSGIKLVFAHWRAMFAKRLIFHMHHKYILSLILFSPILFTWLAFFACSYSTQLNLLQSMTFRLAQYPSSVTIIDDRHGVQNGPSLIAEKYRDLVLWMGLLHQIKSSGSKIFSEYIIDKQQEEQEVVNKKYLVGVSVGQDDIIAWFNNYPLHTAPLSLNLVHNAMLNAFIDPNAKIVVSLEPLPFVDTVYAENLRSLKSVAHYLAMNITFCLSFVWSINIFFLVEERVTHFKLLQYISGVRFCTFWLTTYVNDVLQILVSSMFVLATIVALEPNYFHQYEVSLFFFLVLVVFGVCVMPLYYLISTAFTDPNTAYSVISIVSIYGGLMFSSLMEVLERDYTSTLATLPEWSQWVLLVIPHYAVCNALSKVFLAGKLRKMCMNKNIYFISVEMSECTAEPNCCDPPDELSWSTRGILPEMAYLVMVAVVSTILLVILEIREVTREVPKDNKTKTLEEYNRWHNNDPMIDDEVVYEKMRVRTLRPTEYYGKALVLRCIGKNHKSAEIINRLNLVLERSECLGLLGVNASGKSSLLKMLTGDIKVSYGGAYVNGHSLTEDLYGMYKRIGYCPQIDAVMDEFTGSQLMRIHCQLRGLPGSKIPDICEGLAKVLDFMSHYDEPIRMYSSGQRRRLSIAIAILGKPSLVYLDDPASCLDAGGRRQLWNVVCMIRQTGGSIFLTSLSARECERICTRVAMIMHGRFRCLGTTRYLCERFSRGYLLKIKVKQLGDHQWLRKIESVPSDVHVMSTPFLKLQAFMEQKFPSAILKDNRGYTLIYLIPLGSVPISQIFLTLQRNIFSLNIENFSVSRATLSVMFIDLAEHNARESKRSSRL